MVEITEVWSVDGGTREQGRRQRREGLGWVFEQRGSGMAVAANKISSKTSSFDNFIRATLAIGKFSDSTGGSITVDLDLGHY
jgi:hypothetical protein